MNILSTQMCASKINIKYYHHIDYTNIFHLNSFKFNVALKFLRMC